MTMKRSKKPLTFAAIIAGIGALSLAVESCVYGPPAPTRETNVYGPPPDDVVVTVTETEEMTEKRPFKPSADQIENLETDVYGPPPDYPIDGPEEDVYGPPPEDEI